MRIAIDARLNAYRQGGIPQYTRHLLAALAEVAPDDQFITLQHRDQLRPLAIAPNVARRMILTPPHHRFEQWTMPLELLLLRPDVLHCPDFIAPLRRPSPAVVTIHDLAFMHYPEILDDAARAYYGQVMTNAPRADGIIAVSEATRQDVAQFLDLPIEQIDMIYEAPAPLYGRMELRKGEARVLNATPVAAGSFMLFVSTLEPRKNLPTLLHALRICLDRRPDRPYRLVVVGSRGWRDEAIFDAVRDLRLADHVLFAGRVGQYDLRWLYNACQFYINPSLYEGFGLPLLEAMACGAACLASASSSLPEIGGDAAIYIPPLDPGAWADAIEELWGDPERQAELGRLGRARAQRFSWMRAARETLKVYQRVAERAQPEAATVTLRRQEVAEAFIEEQSGASTRACLRCGAQLLPGEVRRDVAVVRPESPFDSLALRAWACPSCRYVELVAEPVPAVAAKLGDVVPAPVDLAQRRKDATSAETDAPPVEAFEPQPIAAEATLAPEALPVVETEEAELEISPATVAFEPEPIAAEAMVAPEAPPAPEAFEPQPIATEATLAPEALPVVETEEAELEISPATVAFEPQPIAAEATAAPEAPPDVEPEEAELETSPATVAFEPEPIAAEATVAPEAPPGEETTEPVVAKESEAPIHNGRVHEEAIGAMIALTPEAAERLDPPAREPAALPTGGRRSRAKQIVRAPALPHEPSPRPDEKQREGRREQTIATAREGARTGEQRQPRTKRKRSS